MKKLLLSLLILAQAVKAQQAVVTFNGALYSETTNAGGQVSLAPVTQPIVTFNSRQYLQSTNANGQVSLTPVTVAPSALTAVVSTNTPVQTEAVTVNPITVAATVLGSNSALGVLETLQSYIVDNDVNYHGWDSNAFSLNESAVFSDVKGVQGASTLGNDLGIDLPIHKWNVSIDESTRFEQLAGDVADVEFGPQYDYNDYQIQFNAGVNVRYAFAGNRVNAVPYVGFAKALTGIPSLSPFFRYEYPITSHSGSGEVKVGMVILIGKKLYGAAVN
jgi:hypothetical protein